MRLAFFALNAAALPPCNIASGKDFPCIIAWANANAPAIPPFTGIDIGKAKFRAVFTTGKATSLKKKLFAIRLDTPSSRRGDFQKIIVKIRWELNIRGFGHVKIYVSGGLDEKRILSLNPIVDAYGVGTSITNARSIDLAMDIIEIEGKPLAKRGKMSGSKTVLRCAKCFQDRLVPYQPRKNSSSRGLNRCSCGGRYQEILLPRIQNQRVLQDLPTPQAIRKYVLQQLPHFDL